MSGQRASFFLFTGNGNGYVANIPDCKHARCKLARACPGHLSVTTDIHFRVPVLTDAYLKGSWMPNCQDRCIP